MRPAEVLVKFERELQLAGRVWVSLAMEVTRSPRADRDVPIRNGLAAVLGLTEDAAYGRDRQDDRAQTIETLSGCCPANATPEAMAGYVAEAALRFRETLRWVEDSVSALGVEKPRILEIGSNPFFQTVLIADRFPRAEHLGVNYFGAPSPRFESQAVTDPRKRVAESRFYHADIERHDLAPAGLFDVVLFCEVLEHLPYDPAWAVWNVVRRLRPGGHLILSTPNPARVENIVRLAEERGTFSDPISGFGIHGRHNREYSAAELRDLLHGAGCRVAGQTTVDVHPDAWSREAERKGYGAYHLIRAVRGEEEPPLVRPSWLYRSFAPQQLASLQPLVPGSG